jgi:hypothetical protein
MRKHLRNHEEVCHFWANQVQPEGRSGNMFFENDTIFSYGHHFAIAKHYDGAGVILFTNQSYSPSTGTHKSLVRRAIPHGAKILYCHNPSRPDDSQNLESAINEIEYNLKKAIRARQRKLDYVGAAEYAYNQLVALRDTFKIKGWKIPKYDFTVPESVKRAIEERDKKAAAARKRAKAKRRKQDEIDKVDFFKDVERWKAGEIGLHQIKHQRFRYDDGRGDLCRINGDVVETLRNADAPKKEVIAILKRIKQGKPVHGLELGHYTIVGFDNDVLTIGCHKFKRPEIDWLMAELGI